MQFLKEGPYILSEFVLLLFIRDVTPSVYPSNDIVDYNIPTGHQKNHFKMVSRGNIYEQVYYI